MNEIKFADIFNGVDGFRLGLEEAGPFRCVWSCDNSKYANQVHYKNYGKENHYPADIRGVDPEDIPDFDLLCAGFPCQSFSTAGSRQGFQDTRGTLYFEISRIAEAKRPSMLLLENVAGLLSNDRGQTFHTILQDLGRLGYWVEWQVLDGISWLPQQRKRVFIIGHLDPPGRRSKEIFPIREQTEVAEGSPRGAGKQVVRCLTANYGKRPQKHGEQTVIIQVRRSSSTGRRIAHARSTSTPTLMRSMGDTFRTVPLAISFTNPHDQEEKRRANLREDVRTITATPHREHVPIIIDAFNQVIRGGAGVGALKTNMGSSTSTNIIIVDDIKDLKPRILMPIEGERLQGFPDNWTQGLSDTRRYECIGNSVMVPVVKFLGEKIIQALGRPQPPS